MSWTIRCATSVTGLAVVANLHPSSALMSRACSITVNNAGRSSTHGPGESSTSRWSKKAPTGPEPCLLDGKYNI